MPPIVSGMRRLQRMRRLRVASARSSARMSAEGSRQLPLSLLPESMSQLHTALAGCVACQMCS